MEGQRGTWLCCVHTFLKKKPQKNTFAIIDSATSENFLISTCRSHIHESSIRSPQGLCIYVTFNFCNDQGKVSVG